MNRQERDLQDNFWFKAHPGRQFHARRPEKNECEIEFRSLGDHNAKRRMIILWLIPEGTRAIYPSVGPVLKIPFLAFSDETIEDTDEILGPLFHGIMVQASD